MTESIKKPIEGYVNDLGFTNHCYDSGDGNVRCLSNLEGVFVTINFEEKQIEISAMDGLIKSSATMSYPNAHIPIVIDKMYRHAKE